MKKSMCEDCQYFVQHYSISEGKVFPIHCAHCLKRTGKLRFSCTHTKCEMFEPRATDYQKAQNKEIIDTLDNIREQIYNLKSSIQKDA